MRGKVQLRTLGLNGACLSYRHAGQGQDVVLLHGISSRAASWHKQLADAALTNGCRLWAWDAPGYGDSTPLVPLRPSAAEYAAVLAQWLDALQLGRVILVGHSLGAMMAAAFAARWPARTAGLILADPAQGYATEGAERRRQVFLTRVRQAEDINAYAAQRAQRLLRPDAQADDLATVQQGMMALRKAGFLAAAGMLADDALMPYLSDYRGPLEVWCGAQDTITPPEDAGALARRVGAPLHLLPAAGHASYLDASQVFNQLLCRFTRRIATGEMS